MAERPRADGERRKARWRYAGRYAGRALRPASARAALVLVVVLLGGALYVRLGPVPGAVLSLDDAQPSVQVYDRHGEPLYEARSERGTRGASLRTLPPDRLPPVVVAATLAAEDHRFRSHPGVDPIAVARAFWRNLRAWRVVEGGSTISQQVVALAEARAGRAAARTWWGKVRESVIALRLEHRLTKDEILARYLTFAPYGNQIEGIARASTYYFGVTADELTPSQAAYLAALPQRPGRFNPRRDPTVAQARQQHILRRMHEQEWLDAGALQVALAERTHISASEPESIAPHWVQRALAHAPESGPVEPFVRTTLDAPLQRTVLGILRAQQPLLAQHHARQVSVVVLDNHTNEWRVWVTIGSDIDAAMTPRQPGSALKPFTYAAAFERGWHPGRVLADIPSTFPTAEPGILYSPRNYDGRFRGPLRARLALAGSENVPAVALAADIGVPAVADLLRRVGISTLDKTATHYGLGLTLGNAEVRLDELTRAYSLFASHEKTSGVFSDEKYTRRNSYSARTRYWITDILSDPDARRYIFGEGSSLDFPFTVAVKTGTSQAYHDNWTIGFTRDVTVGVWVGNLDRTPLRYSSGVSGAGPIFHDVMLAAVEHARGAVPLFDSTPIQELPDGLRDVTLCADSGMVAGAACPARVREHLPHDADGTTCTWHHASERGVITIYPEPYRSWAAGVSSNAPGTDAPAPPLTSAPAHQRAAFGITSPPTGATYLIDPTLRPDFQTLPLRAQGAVGRVEWRLNNRPLGTTLGDTPLAWTLTRGSHTITARDANGQTAQSRIVIR
jgi:penicillin-binding protein 1C